MYTQYSPKDKFDVGYYLIAYIDILGQRESLQRFKKLPETQDDDREFRQTLKATFGAIDEIRLNFDRAIKPHIDGPKEYPLKMTVEQRDQFEELSKLEIKTQRFADTIVFYLPLNAKKGHRLPIGGVYAVLMACSIVFLAALAGKQVLRGSLEVGLAAEMCDGEIYGPALFEAYRLESKVAQYPRIIIGDTLIDYLRGCANDQGPDVESRLRKKSAETCLTLIAQDLDGYHILDYLGEGIRQILSPDKRIQEIDKAETFLTEQADRWKNERNTELAARYMLTIAYFLSRRFLWEQSAPKN